MDGRVPIWDAILSKHEEVVKILADNGADISSGNMGHYACVAAQQNSLEILEAIVRYGGDVNIPKIDGTTALHLAVYEGNLQVVKFLVDHGADIDKPDNHGWSPRELADQQSHEEIKALFKEKPQRSDKSTLMTNSFDPPHWRFSPQPSAVNLLSQESQISRLGKGTVGKVHQRRKASFHNSLFGIMSAVHAVDSHPDQQHHSTPLRVTISCPERSDIFGKLVLLPGTLEELFYVGSQKFGLSPAKVLTKDGAEIEDINLIRDGDHLILVTDSWKGHDVN